MPLCIGTNDGVYRAAAPDADPKRVNDAGVVRQVRRLDGTLFAATDDGLVRSTGGHTWTACGVPEPAAVAVAASPDGRHLYAGTRPAHVYVSSDGGESWQQSEAFASFPGREAWENLGDVGPQVRAFAVHPHAPDRVIAGVEAAGVYVSTDRGDTWERRSDGLNPDVHGLTALGRDDWVAACGRGCYRTTDAGRTWTSLDTGVDQFWYTYHREALARDGVLYVGAQNRAAARYADDAPGLLLSSTDAGGQWTSEPYPGDDDAFPLAWADHDERVLAGTNDGRVIAREDDEWRVQTAVPTGLRSLAAW